MFDIGFSELALVFLIGLIVLGPDRLPKVARALGLWVRRARGYASKITSELERELDIAEMREHFKETGDHLKRTGEDFKRTGEDFQSQVTDLRDSIESGSASGSGKRDHFRRARATKIPTQSESSPAEVESQEPAHDSSDDDSKSNTGE